MADNKKLLPDNPYASRVPTVEELREYNAGAKERAAKIKMYQDEADEYKKPASASVDKKSAAASVDKKATGGKVKSASARADGCAIRGKTRA